MLVPLIASPKIDTPVMKAATKLEYGFDGQSKPYVKFTVGEGPIVGGFKFGYDKKLNKIETNPNIKIEVTKTQSFKLNSDKTIEYGNRTINNFDRFNKE